MLDAMTFVLLPHYLSKLPYPPLSTYRLAVKKISEFSMEKVNYPEGKRDFMKEAECMGKEACESNPTEMKRLADDIMPHLLNLVKQIKSAFYSLSKVFSESRIVEYSVTEKVISSGKQEILIDNKQQYKFLGRNIDMISLIRLSVEDGKVVRHEDWWDKKPLRNRETVKLPFVGRMMELTRRGSMLATHALMGFGKDPTG
ncbi:uncharacterized protein LOC111296898 isoform X3 [Durio zibethinus]|uniref:Uncharacterized protein LOC111296898 isoform X3 n=1 Tax=Durio zibethinus TaxID=66656 RepID=A0A6P5Z2Y8_DURZI|nr:uncharacterized protein LOC111296898 isoform X3 [Durio zibethinus]